MKNLYDCNKSCKVRIVKLNAEPELKQRLISFGILKGVKIKYLTHTSLKGTYEIQVGKMNIALRKEEAEKIEVLDNEKN